MFRATTAALLVLIACVPLARSEVIRVPGDATFLLGAFAQASSGDTILVAPGHYSGSGNRGLDFSGRDLTVLSEGGSSITTIDCGLADRVFEIDEGEHAVVEGFTILSGVGVRGGAMLLDGGATAEVRDCVFEGCHSTAGGVATCFDGCFIFFADCVFVANSADMRGGVIEALYEVTVVLERCEFYECGAPAGGVIRALASSLCEAPDITAVDCRFSGNVAEAGAVVFADNCGTFVRAEGCIFEENVCTGSPAYGGGIIGVLGTCGTYLTDCLFRDNSAAAGRIVEGSIGSIDRATFTGNASEEGVVGTGSVSNTIIAFSTEGPAVAHGGSPTLTCCDIFGNAGGDWTPSIAGQLGLDGNICVDPLFCGGENPDEPYALHADSPCAAANSGGCGTIGLYDVGCVATATEAVSWGSLKALYRD